jgi:hypothetical protein
MTLPGNLAYQRINKVAQYEMKNERDELAKLCSLHLNAIDQLLMISKHIISKLMGVVQQAINNELPPSNEPIIDVK